MATVQTTILAERWLDEVLVQGSVSNVDGDVDDVIVLPPGIGDLALMAFEMIMRTIATVGSFVGSSGRLNVFASSGGITDLVCWPSQARILHDGTASVFVHIVPDHLVLVRQGESLRFRCPELDTNASPTGDITYTAKFVRVPDIRTAPGPIRLVR